MKTILLFLFLLISLASFSQNIGGNNDYDFTLIQNSQYNYTVAAVAKFDSGVIGPKLNSFIFTILLPVNASVDQSTIVFNTDREGTIQVITDSQLGTVDPDFVRDATVIGSDSLFLVDWAPHSQNEIIDLVTFDVLGAPLSEEILLASNDFPPNSNSSAFNSGLTIDTAGGTDAIDEYAGQTGITSYSFDPPLATNSFTTSNFSLTPNPNNGQFVISGNFPAEKITLEIYNVTGQLVYHSSHNTFDKSTIDFDVAQQLAKGAYVVHMNSGNAVASLKLILQ